MLIKLYKNNQKKGHPEEWPTIFRKSNPTWLSEKKKFDILLQKIAPNKKKTKEKNHR